MTFAPSLLTRHAPTVGAALLFTALHAHAAPVASGPAIAGDGNGLNALWVYTTGATPQTIADAETILANAGNDGYVAQTTVVPFIDVTDGGDGTAGHFLETPLLDPFTGTFPGDPDPRFAVRFSGFLNVRVAGDYQFQAHTDDGFRLSIGNESIVEFDGNRGPSDSTSEIVSLDAGLYSIEMIGWEQGGIFVDELGWARLLPDAQSVSFSLVPQAALFTAQPVPLPPALPLAAAGFAALAARRRRAART